MPIITPKAARMPSIAIRGFMPGRVPLSVGKSRRADIVVRHWVVCVTVGTNRPPDASALLAPVPTLPGGGVEVHLGDVMTLPLSCAASARGRGLSPSLGLPSSRARSATRF